MKALCSLAISGLTQFHMSFSFSILTIRKYNYTEKCRFISNTKVNLIMYFSDEDSETKWITKLLSYNFKLCDKSLTETFVIIISKWGRNKIRLHPPVGTYCSESPYCHSTSKSYFENQWQPSTNGLPDGQAQWLGHERRCQPEIKAVICFVTAVISRQTAAMEILSVQTCTANNGLPYV